ncbi:MAG: hypothetical protein IT535_00060 [Bauldia sp.]|nr:hypothetical protein [Bauldia sp.]
MTIGKSKLVIGLMTAATIVASPPLRQLASKPSAIAATVSEDRLDEIMLMPAADNWSPSTFLDLRYPWPDEYVEEHRQPFEPWTFAKNAAAIVHFVKARGLTATIDRQIKYLAFTAGLYTRSEGGCTYVTNEFEYQQMWSMFASGFKGAFMNAVTAYGYIYLFQASGDRSYLEKARVLLASAAECESDTVKLHSVDGQGQFWLNEYVFRVPSQDEGLFQAMGFEQNADGAFRSRIYNGHIHALLAYIKYGKVAGVDDFDEVIAKSIETVRYYLPSQLYNDRYFSYQVEFPLYPDYGQARAVSLAEGLCEITGYDDLCRTARAMRKFYDERIRRSESAVYEAGYRATRDWVDRWRAEHQQPHRLRASRRGRAKARRG